MIKSNATETLFCDGEAHIVIVDYAPSGDFGTDDDGVPIGRYHEDLCPETQGPCDGTCTPWKTLKGDDIPEPLRD